jgi:hypothetical protein
MVVARARAARTTLVVCCLLGGGWLVFALYAYPGYMSFDSGWQLREARAGWFTDWHPPVMAQLWRWIDALYAGPLGMLVVQSVAFLAGAFLVLRRVLAPIAAAVAACCVLLFPPIAMTLAVIWKDSLMTGLLVLACGIAVSGHRRAFAGAALVFIVASSLRHNAFTITLPLLLAFSPWRSLRWWVRIAIAVAVWLAITLAAHGLNRALTDEATHPWHGSLAMFDIVGTLRYAPPLDDAELRTILAGTPLGPDHDLHAQAIAAYSPFEGVFMIIRKNFMRQPTTATERAAIARAWQTLTLDYPGAYLRHRWRAYRELLQLTHRDMQWAWIGYDAHAGFHHDAGPLQAKLQRGAASIARSWLMHPYLYALLVLALLPFCFAKGSELALALSASAIVSELALFFVSPTPDFRYSLWLVVCAMIVPILLVTARAASASRAALPPDHRAAHCAMRST